MNKMQTVELSEVEQVSEVINILQYIADYPLEGDVEKRSNDFRTVQKHAQKVLVKLGHHRLKLE